MSNALDCFGGNFLKAEDIKQETRLTIKSATIEEMPDGRSKPVVTFDEIDRKLVCNKINTTRISEWAGSSMTENWSGIVITLYTGSVEYDGKDVPCIRVKKKGEAA